MQRLIVALLFFLIDCLWIGSDLWSGADMKNTNSRNDLHGSSEVVRVLWTVSDYKMTDSAVWTENKAKAMLFKPLDIDDTSITFDRKKCDNVSFETKEARASKYLDQHYNISPQWLGIADETLKVIRTTRDMPGFTEYMRLQDRRLVIFLHDVFFFLEPHVTY
jgi:hypothetical protein